MPLPLGRWLVRSRSTQVLASLLVFLRTSYLSSSCSSFYWSSFWSSWLSSSWLSWLSSYLSSCSWSCCWSSCIIFVLKIRRKPWENSTCSCPSWSQEMAGGNDDVFTDNRWELEWDELSWVVGSLRACSVLISIMYPGCGSSTAWVTWSYSRPCDPASCLGQGPLVNWTWEGGVCICVYIQILINYTVQLSYILILQHLKFEVNIEHLICTGLDSLIWHRGMPDEAWLPPGSWGVLSFFCFSFFLFRPRQRIVSLNLSSLFLWPRKFLRRMKISPILLRQWSWKTPGQWSHVRCWLKYLWTAHFQLFQP